METNKSSILIESLENVIINGDVDKLTLLATALFAISELGDYEHSSDWDPYITIHLKNGESIDSYSGHFEIEFGDFNDSSDQLACYRNKNEITNIIVPIDVDTSYPSHYKLINDYSDVYVIEISIPIDDIVSISVINQ